MVSGDPVAGGFLDGRPQESDGFLHRFPDSQTIDQASHDDRGKQIAGTGIAFAPVRCLCLVSAIRCDRKVPHKGLVWQSSDDACYDDRLIGMGSWKKTARRVLYAGEIVCV